MEGGREGLAGRATCPVLREDQWERFQESYALSLAFPLISLLRAGPGVVCYIWGRLGVPKVGWPHDGRFT